MRPVRYVSPEHLLLAVEYALCGHPTVSCTKGSLPFRPHNGLIFPTFPSLSSYHRSLLIFSVSAKAQQTAPLSIPES